MIRSERTIEVGCGPGFHSSMLASNFLKTGAVLVSCDISSEMIKSLKQTYESETCDFSKVPQNTFHIDTTTNFSEYGEST